jgi:hypothetical protein
VEKGAVSTGLLEPPVPGTGVVPLLTGYGTEYERPVVVGIDKIVLSPEGRVNEELGVGATVEDTEPEGGAIVDLEEPVPGAPVPLAVALVVPFDTG